MITVNRLNKPKILTETDRLLSDMSNEMSELHERMNLLEQEQAKSKSEINTLQEQQQVWLERYQKEVAGNQENYQVIADIMHNLKKPVSAVIENLEEIIGNVADEEVKLSLQACMQEASKVLTSFEHVEDFCQDLSTNEIIDTKEVALDALLQPIIEPLEKHGVVVDVRYADNIPPNVSVDFNLYTKVLQRLCAEVLSLQKSKTVTLRVLADNQNNANQLQVHIDLEEQLDMKWNKTWVNTICDQHDKFLYSGLNILKINSLLRQDGNALDVRVVNDNLAGFYFDIQMKGAVQD